MGTILNYYMALGTYVVLFALVYAVYRYFIAVYRNNSDN